MLYVEEWSSSRHRRFLRACRKLTCPIVTSTYLNDIYSAELGDWAHVDFQAMTRGGVRTERGYCNYDPAAVAGNNYFLGIDYRDCWRLKKKARRHVAKFAAMPAAEALYVLRHVIDRVAPDFASPDPAVLSAVPGVPRVTPNLSLSLGVAPQTTRGSAR